MPKRKLSGYDRFFRRWDRIAEFEEKVAQVLRRRSGKWLATRNVVGFGVGMKDRRTAAIFYVENNGD